MNKIINVILNFENSKTLKNKEVIDDFMILLPSFTNHIYYDCLQ